MGVGSTHNHVTLDFGIGDLGETAEKKQDSVVGLQSDGALE
jgi:hypothetical protein